MYDCVNTDLHIINHINFSLQTNHLLQIHFAIHHNKTINKVNSHNKILTVRKAQIPIHLAIQLDIHHKMTIHLLLLPIPYQILILVLIDYPFVFYYDNPHILFFVHIYIYTTSNLDKFYQYIHYCCNSLLFLYLLLIAVCCDFFLHILFLFVTCNLWICLPVFLYSFHTISYYSFYINLTFPLVLSIYYNLHTTHSFYYL